MSLNWVMLGSGAQAFVPLPNEHTLWLSPLRTAIQLQSLNKYPGRDPFHLSSNSGHLHLTNQRVVYLAEHSSPAFESFSVPILRVRDSRVTTPFFGPNTWLASVTPVPGGGIPAQHLVIEAKVTFKDGGAYDFHTKFVQIKERLKQARDVAAESGETTASTPAGGADMRAVHLEQLPAYEEHDPGGSAAVDNAVGNPTATHPAEEPPISLAQPRQSTTTPDEPPPGYEDVQRSALIQHGGRNEQG